jgi:hypothetical protein
MANKNKPGQRLRFLGTERSDGTREAFGTGDGAIQPGTVMEYVGQVDADTPGAGGSDDAVAVLRFGAPSLRQQPDGELAVNWGERRWSVLIDALGTWFEATDDDVTGAEGLVGRLNKDGEAILDGG